MKYKTSFLLFCLAFLLAGCRKDLVMDPNNTYYYNDLEQFVRVWEGLNTNYALWSIDTTDWDRIYDKYHAVFSNESMPDSVWARHWRDLTASLIDHHLIIKLKRPSTGAEISLCPGYDEVRSRNYFHYFSSIDAVISSLELFWSGRLTDKVSSESLFYGMIDRTIAYLRIDKFDLSVQDSSQMNVFQRFKKAVSDSQTKAVIVDLRDNPGGNALDLGTFMSCFVNEPYLIGYTQSKIGLGRMDLGPRIPCRVIPLSESQKVNCPIIALVDVNSASMAEIATLAIKLLPNGYVVGERTFGATCALPSNPYADPFGVFGNENNLGHYVYTPFVLFTGVDGSCYEGYGIEPDKTCYLNRDEYVDGVDNQLICAIQFALSKAQ